MTSSKIETVLSTAEQIIEYRKSLISKLEQLDLNAQDDSGRTALMLAAEMGDPEAVRLLLEAGADPYIENENNETALQLAISETSTRVVIAFIDAGTDLNWPNSEGNTALDFALYHDESADYMTGLIRAAGGNATGRPTREEIEYERVTELLRSLSFRPSSLPPDEHPTLKKLEDLNRGIPGCSDLFCTTCGGLRHRIAENIPGELKDEAVAYYRSLSREDKSRLGSWDEILQELSGP